MQIFMAISSFNVYGQGKESDDLKNWKILTNMKMDLETLRKQFLWYTFKESFVNLKFFSLIQINRFVCIKKHFFELSKLSLIQRNFFLGDPILCLISWKKFNFTTIYSNNVLFFHWKTENNWYIVHLHMRHTEKTVPWNQRNISLIYVQRKNFF